MAKKGKKVSGLWAEFKAFISKGNVVDMAVGVAVATAFTAIVTAFTKGFISPILALLSHDATLADFKWVLREAETHTEAGAEVVDKPEVAILWGAFLQAVLDFIIIALVLFLFLKIVLTVAKKAKAAREAAAAKITGADEERAKAEAEAKAKEEEEKRAAEEAQAAAEAAAAAEEARKQKMLELLEEIAASLKKEGK